MRVKIHVDDVASLVMGGYASNLVPDRHQTTVQNKSSFKIAIWNVRTMRQKPGEHRIRNGKNEDRNSWTG